MPPARFSLRNLFEMLTDAVLGIAEPVMGVENARRFLPLIGTLACFIFFSNVLALIPGFVPPTATLKTNVALALTVFTLTHVYGLAANGLGYFKQFLGHAPVYMAPFMIPIEIVSHLARPVSLSLRLLGNIFAHTPEGTSFRLEVKTRPEGGTCLAVEDSGPGLAENLVERGVSGGGSTGLGLDIVRRTAEGAGGAMHIGRGPAGGTRIELDFPAVSEPA